MKFLSCYLHMGYYYPSLTFCLVGFICHPSWLWVFGFIVTCIFYGWMFTWADIEASLKRLKEACNYILNGDYFLHPVDSSVYDSIKKFCGAGVYQEMSRISPWFKNTMEKSSLYDNISKEPLLIFSYKHKDATKNVTACKAYTNLLGPSLVFLNQPPESMNAFASFRLLHELEHVNRDGAEQLSQIHARPIALVFAVIFLSFIASIWWQWLIIIIYVLLNLVSYIRAGERREAIADNGALRKLSTLEEQKEAVEFFIELDQNLNDLSEPELKWETLKERLEIITELSNEGKLNNQDDRDRIKELMYRLGYFKWYQECLNNNENLPYLSWIPFEDRLFAFLFNLFFLYLGIITAFPPAIPFLLMLLSVVLYVFYNKRLEEFLEISNEVESRIVKS